MKQFPVILVFYFTGCVLFAQTKKDTLIHNGLEREYYVHLPQSYDSLQTYALVLALHGGGGKANKFNKSTKGRFNDLSNTQNFIVVYPQGIGKSWNDHPKRNPYGKARQQNIDDVGFIDKMIKKLESGYSIDSSRIFACGISNGGLMAATLAVKLPDKIKAIAMVSSNFSQVFIDDILQDSLAVKPFSILVIHGTKDPIFPYSEGDITAFKKKRGRVIGVDKTIDYMCKTNGNSTQPVITRLPDINPFDTCTETQFDYPNTLDPNIKIRLIKINGGGHTWAGGNQYFPKRIIGVVCKDFNAADKIWEFFREITP